MVLKEQQQLRRIRKGDILSFEELFRLSYQGMYSYAKTLVRSGEIAEEVVQDVFYNIWKNRETLRIVRNWQSYLYRSVYNNAMMSLRRTRKETILESDKFTELEGSTPDPSQVMEYREVSEMVTRTIGELPDRTREIFLLNREEGLRYNEIADRLSISVKTVEANMGKALRALREGLGKYEGE